MRLLSGILAAQPFATRLIGDDSLSKRPMRRVVEPLTQMGASITALGANDSAPLVIRGGTMHGISYSPPMASAQVKSAILFAGLYAHGVTTVIEKTPTRNHTEVMMRECGAAIEVTKTEAGERISVAGRKPLGALGSYTVAGDLSSASFFIVAALLVPDAELRLRHIGINP